MSYPFTDQIGPDARIKVSSGGETTALGRLTDWFADNADGISPAEQVDIVQTLARGETYHGGGGAAGDWTVELGQ